MTNQNKNIEKSAGSVWVEKAKFRISNRKWLRYSTKIAFRILAAMEDIPNINQKKLAEMAGVSPQQVNKIIKGQENLTLQTIAKFSDILGVELISFPSFKYNQSTDFMFNFNSNQENFLCMGELKVYQTDSPQLIPLESNFPFELNTNKYLSQ